MTTRILRFLAIVATGFLALRAFAHEVDCDKTVGILQIDRNGQPVLGTDGLPLFVAPPSTTLELRQYPLTIGWRIQVHNLAAEESFIQLFDDPLLADYDAATRIYGWIPHPGVGGPRIIPAGQSTEAIVTQTILSYEQCVGLELPNLASAPDGQMCRDGRVNTLTITTESNVAVCKARLKCKPEPQLPPTCRRVKSIVWCYNPELCGAGCEAVCNSLGRATSISDAYWFEAQNEQAECDAISSAFGVTPPPAPIDGFVYGCVEDAAGDHSGGELLGPFICSDNPACPANHRTGSDQFGVPCSDDPSRLSVCPCQEALRETIR